MNKWEVRMATIRKRCMPSGKIAWQVDFNDVGGRRRSKQFRTRREADAFLVNARAEVSSGSYVHDFDSVTVETAAALWLDYCAKRCEQGRRMEKTTWIGYECHVRLHICNTEFGIGNLKLSRLNKKVVAGFRDGLLARGRSDRTTRKILSSLSLILKYAQEDGLTLRNPVDGMRVLRTSRLHRKIDVPSRDDVRNLVAAASERFRPYLIVAALCGLRASEQRALHWPDVDFDQSLVHVRRRVDAYNEFGEPKSSAGYRSVPMGPMVSNTLRSWKLMCPPSSLDLVFPTKRGGVQSHSNILRRHFKPLCVKAGVAMRWHDLRHMAVSLWIEQGFPPKAIMEFAGHSSIQLTFDLYGHLLPSPDYQQGMAEVEARLLG
jgi:integrase